MIRPLLVIMALALMSCDDDNKTEAPQIKHKQNLGSDSWVSRSENDCGPGYVRFFYNHFEVCVAYRLPNPKQEITQ